MQKSKSAFCGPRQAHSHGNLVTPRPRTLRLRARAICAQSLSKTPRYVPACGSISDQDQGPPHCVRHARYPRAGTLWLFGFRLGRRPGQLQQHWRLHLLLGRRSLFMDIYIYITPRSPSPRTLTQSRDPKFLEPGMSSLTIPSSTSRRPRRDMPHLEPKYNLKATIPSNSC